jgi:hypothetical protein
MAEYDITITLLTPISIRLDIESEYTGEVWEVWWKSDHPAGQEFALLGRTTDKTYVLDNLSWTTTYYFKARSSWGASSYGHFGSVVEVFICCGQAYPTVPVLPAGGTDAWWQQGIDIDGDIVAFEGRSYGGSSAEFIQLWKSSIGSDSWTRNWKKSGLWWMSYQAAVRVNGGKTAVLDVYYPDDDGTGGDADAAYKFYLTNNSTGEILNELTWPNPEAGNTRAYVNEGSNQFLLEYNDNNRIVAGLWSNSYGLSLAKHNATTIRVTVPVLPGYGWNGTDEFEVWWSSPTANPPGTTLVLHGSSTTSPYYITGAAYGNTYTVAVAIPAMGGWLNYPMVIEMAAAPRIHYDYSTLYFMISQDGGVTFAAPEFVLQNLGYGYASMSEAADGAIWIMTADEPPRSYTLFKWIEGAGATLITTIVPTQDIQYFSPIYAEGEKIAFVYIDSATRTVFSYDIVYKLVISTDNGANWTTKPITGLNTVLWSFTDGWYPPFCIADGNLIFQITDPSVHKLIMSEDNGDTWTATWTWTTEYIPYLAVAALRSDGEKVVWASCRFASAVGEPMAFLYSDDAGATWTMKEMQTAVDVLVPVPA